MRPREAVQLIRTPMGRRWLRKNIRKRLYTRRESVCVRRDLTIPLPPLPAKIPLSVRPLRPDDDLSLIADEPGLAPEVAQLRADQRWMLSSDLPRPWVAIDSNGAVCFIAYLLTAKDNPQVQALWKGWLPEIQPDEVMLEGFFTAASHRGLGIMGDAGTRMLEEMCDSTIHYGIGFILTTNASSLRVGVDKAGWIPYLKREERWTLFHRRVRFYPVDDGAEARSRQPVR
jgi:hypothetical protein